MKTSIDTIIESLLSKLGKYQFAISGSEVRSVDHTVSFHPKRVSDPITDGYMVYTEREPVYIVLSADNQFGIQVRPTEDVKASASLGTLGKIYDEGLDTVAVALRKFVMGVCDTHRISEV